MAVTAWLANYPYSDPLFQFFQVQQYLTQPGVNPAVTYTIVDGVVHQERLALENMKANLGVETQEEAKALEAAAEAPEPEDAEPVEKPAAKPRAPRKTAAKDAS